MQRILSASVIVLGFALSTPSTHSILSAQTTPPLGSCNQVSGSTVTCSGDVQAGVLLDTTLGALEVKLSSDQIARLNTASEIPLGTPHEQINSSAATIAGGKPELLELPVIPAA